MRFPQLFLSQQRLDTGTGGDIRGQRGLRDSPNAGGHARSPCPPLQTDLSLRVGTEGTPTGGHSGVSLLHLFRGLGTDLGVPVAPCHPRVALKGLGTCPCHPGGLRVLALRELGTRPCHLRGALKELGTHPGAPCPPQLTQQRHPLSPTPSAGPRGHSGGGLSPVPVAAPGVNYRAGSAR